MKVVKEATIEIVKLKDLEVGDFILYSNFMCQIKERPMHVLHPLDRHSQLKVRQFAEDPSSTMYIGPFRNYYKIKSVETIDACISCGKEIPEERDDKNMCEGCYIEQIMGHSINPENGEPWTEEEIRIELDALKDSEAEWHDRHR